jgi:DNA primase
MDEFESIVELISDFLGDPKKIYENKSQVSWDCPVCDDGRNKGNLEVNIDKEVYHCWSCGDTEGTHGALGRLFDKYGTKQQKKLYTVLKPNESTSRPQIKKPKVQIPENFALFKDSNPRYPVYLRAYNYLKGRGITDEMIEKFGIGFCDTGSHGGRIIIPSYNKKGELNYYIGRSWDVNSKAKYRNPEAEKDKIIFWENLIDWDKDIYLVEGAFDGMFLDNPVVMLGKHMSELLFETIYEKAKGDIIICLDGDAFKNGLKLYHELNGGQLWGRIKILKLPDDKDVCDLKGQINDYYYNVKN